VSPNATSIAGSPVALHFSSGLRAVGLGRSPPTAGTGSVPRNVLSTRPAYSYAEEGPVAAAYAMDLRRRVLRDTDAGVSSKEFAEG
jgi:hypothetical protein